MYEKTTYDAQGGFVRHTIFNEDMIYAAGAVKAGKKIAYIMLMTPATIFNMWSESFTETAEALGAIVVVT